MTERVEELNHSEGLESLDVDRICSLLDRILLEVQTQQAQGGLYVLADPNLELPLHHLLHYAFEIGRQFEIDGGLPPTFEDASIDNLTPDEEE